ncbi:MAG: flagellar basal body-associated FliL family protein, partial [Parvularculaceae bacterium]
GRTPGKSIVQATGAGLLMVFGATSLLRDLEYAPPINIGVKSAAGVATGRADLVPLRELLVDLAPDRSGRLAYMNMSASIALPAKTGARVIERVKEAEPQIAERITFMLRGLSPEDFDGAAGMKRVKAEMLRRVNLVIAPDVAADVIISDLIIQ